MAKKKKLNINAGGGFQFMGYGPQAEGAQPKLSWKKWPSSGMGKIDMIINWNIKALKEIKKHMA